MQRQGSTGSRFTILVGLLWLVAAFCFGIGVAQGLRPFFDARLSLEPAKPTNADLLLLERTVHPEAAKAWEPSGCIDEFRVIDVAQGAFTKQGARQKAFLYSFCTTGHNFAHSGIVVVEGNQVAAHLIYQGAWGNAIGALPDINTNGLSEIIVSSGGTNQGVTWGVISLLEFSSAVVRKLGLFDTYEDTCGIDSPTPRVKAQRFLVQRGKTPVFFQESYSGTCNSRTWKLSRGIARIQPREDSILYQRIR